VAAAAAAKGMYNSCFYRLLACLLGWLLGLPYPFFVTNIGPPPTIAVPLLIIPPEPLDRMLSKPSVRYSSSNTIYIHRER
jgi:hypothetical protein